MWGCFPHWPPGCGFSDNPPLIPMLGGGVACGSWYGCTTLLDLHPFSVCHSQGATPIHTHTPNAAKVVSRPSFLSWSCLLANLPSFFNFLALPFPPCSALSIGLLFLFGACVLFILGLCTTVINHRYRTSSNSTKKQ